jgi:mono/diheme cytochrome c family protein
MQMRNVIIAVLVIAVGGLVWWWSAASREVAATNASLAEVKLPELSVQAKQGEAAFNTRCAACHGQNASGLDGKGPPLIHIIYETGHHGDAAFFLAAKNGVRAHHWPFGDMPPVENITDDELVEIVHYVRELQRANGIF